MHGKEQKERTPMLETLIGTAKACTCCGASKDLALFYTSGKKVDGSPKYASWCKQCISKKQASYHKRTWGEDKLQYTAFKRTKNVRSYLQYLRAKAVSRKKSEEVISLDALELLWATQKGECALTGWPMTMELANGVVHTNCSIDRTDSSLGYVVGNVQLVCRAVNVAKSNLDQLEFVKLCRAVVGRSNG
jgi:hypothetical protein